ncbi:NUDIX domain-containing protein [Paenibacillus aurantius]|uniref:NUDIX domain-containing protein n=1 Tax=Paenibacillus aurantius TaxID=2918900 RepID=A0AA96LB72_9BACL|nr:NUDIX domain-containing protein [Paenibacillus aurantius]WNQ10689.1 NUDIX domain-containing protein [Paenibacillus aurantius]
MNPSGTVLVASVSILQDDKVLILQENKPEVRNQWNFPGGCLEPGEDIRAAALREVEEETGYLVELMGTTGVYSFISSTNHHVVMFHFIGKITGGSLQLEEGMIRDSQWVTLSELLIPGRYELRGEAVIRQIAENLLAGTAYPLSLFN